MTQVFKALADPSRRKILTLLKQGSMTVSQIQKHFKFTPASLSHHLDILKRANLVIAEREGQFIRYSLNLSAFEEATQVLFMGWNKLNCPFIFKRNPAYKKWKRKPPAYSTP